MSSIAELCKQAKSIGGNYFCLRCCIAYKHKPETNGNCCCRHCGGDTIINVSTKKLEL